MLISTSYNNIVVFCYIIFIVVVPVLVEMAVIPNIGSRVGSIVQDGVPVGASVTRSIIPFVVVGIKSNNHHHHHHNNNH